MKGYTFYEDNLIGRNAVGFGGAIAVYNPRQWYAKSDCMEAISSVQSIPNSNVSNGGVHLDYLEGSTKRISEFKARRIHPVLFARLDGYYGGEYNEDYFTPKQLKMRIWSQLVEFWYNYACTSYWESVWKSVSDDGGNPSDYFLHEDGVMSGDDWDRKFEAFVKNSMDLVGEYRAKKGRMNGFQLSICSDGRRELTNFDWFAVWKQKSYQYRDTLRKEINSVFLENTWELSDIKIY